MKTYNIHLSQSIQGALKNWSKEDWDENGKENGMSGDELKFIFKKMDLEGKKLIPIDGPCDGFSYETGCPMHEIKK